MSIIYAELKKYINIEFVKNFTFTALVEFTLAIDYALKNYKYIQKLCLQNYLSKFIT